MNIFRDGVLIDIDVSFWSGAKALQPEDLGLNKDDVAEAYKLGRKMLIPAKVIKNFRSIEGKARRLVELNSFQFPIGNARFIPKRRFVKILQELKQYQQEYNKLADDLVANYDSYREQMLPIYRLAAKKAYVQRQPETSEFGPDYDMVGERNEFVEGFLNRIKSFYPDSVNLRRRFSLTWDVYEMALPRINADNIAEDQIIKDTAEREYQDQVREKISDFVDEAVKILRQETVNICHRIKDNIVNGKVIKETTINSLKKFIDRFKSLNFVGDYVVEGHLEELRKKLLDKYEAKDIRDNVDLKTELSRHLGELASVASSMTDINSITGEYNRKIAWDESPVMTLKKSETEKVT